MPAALILVGVSGSGKSTVAATYEKQGYIRIERDAIRQELLQTRFAVGVYTPSENLWKHWKWKWEKEVDAAWNTRLEYAMEAKISIVFSDLNLNVSKRENLAETLRKNGYDVEIQYVGLDFTLQQLWKRDENRLNTVGRDVVASQYFRLLAETPKYSVKDTTGKPEAVIFDIDGTLAIMDRTIRSPYDWHKVHLDAANETVWASLVAQMLLKREIIVLSGRDSVCRDLTIEWLEYHLLRTLFAMGFNFSSPLTNFKFGDHNLFMRPQGDQRSDVIIKNELFFEHLDGEYDIKAVFDDRPQVCRGWYDLGLKVIHCDNPYLEF